MGRDWGVGGGERGIERREVGGGGGSGKGGDGKRLGEGGKVHGTKRGWGVGVVIGGGWGGEREGRRWEEIGGRGEGAWNEERVGGGGGDWGWVVGVGVGRGRGKWGFNSCNYTV